ncbi:hypothetical protein QQF64_018033 [Cirrhinus molitorella]|uniref:Uncharacterized protein n=1 Tax=Cirrhinus molitorella TaxID=172907 RepID=A0ABR3LKB9_9TELE
MKIALQTRLHFLISSPPLQAARQQCSPAHKRAKNTHLLLFYRHVLSFLDEIGRAMEKHPMLVVLNSRTRARTRCIQRRASFGHHPHATRCDTDKYAFLTSSGICGLFRPVFDSKGLVDPKMSANRVDEMELERESLTISWRFGLSATLQSALKGKRP